MFTEQFELLPKKYHNSYLFGFCFPLTIVFSLMIWFDYYNIYALFVVGILFLMGEFYFIHQAKSNKFVWILEDIVFFLLIIGFVAFIIKT
ncbi:hypothetical protein [Jeotgalibaca ciconiae]|uniref:Uncharacterized protein n=1 Tax=Jeotgalibaca ciconiae TaxID=2496265 RepID=A0A3Q9BKA7_9LACT|nr:hypothetical protein [Jeotgalibaca ciconiae]AZP04329.1 hypothetical protein EJN90_06555 [Jeotgalibaca ciconiae]